MNCVESQEYLQRLLDGENSVEGRDEFDRHCRECITCRERYDVAERLREAIGSMIIPIPPSDFADRVVASVLKYRHRRVQQRWWWSMAAMLLIAAAGTWAVTYFKPPRVDHSNEIADKRPVPQRPSTRWSSFDQVSSATLGATRNVVQDTVIGVTALIPTSDIFPSPHFPGPVEPSIASIRDVSSMVASGFEPVTDSARRAWDRVLSEPPPENQLK